MICASSSPAMKRYNYRFIATMLGYVAFLGPAAWVFSHHPPTGIVAYLLAVLPAIPIVAGLAVAGIYLGEEKDEFQRTIFIQSMLWSIGSTLVVTTVWGFLEHFLQVWRLELYLVFPLFWFFVGVSSPLIKARYK
jgi:hypothetical protein